MPFISTRYSSINFFCLSVKSSLFFTKAHPLSNNIL
uniref:Uncharacterized protein n=1 Tax=Siphoviridae sp. ctZ1O5 TaxID=2825555 RepID=A0A8S5PDB3_9CAUD|nr:MAG TPA: hypothetical protein [Siphoviridae sp. ctZ1O5]DAO99810.1 MAG TPA: hypothetical protein [Caudoviricetes sp.]DAR25097.1 MAG TPA: hypothetical protein [Caudoviricetes sp.]DAY27105.1 MAG TPA: hypothetical protein [Caudoviricetes sp.]